MLIKITGRVISASPAWVSLKTELIDIWTLDEIGVSVFLSPSESYKQGFTAVATEDAVSTCS